VVGGSGRNGPLIRDVQDRIHELADVLKAGNGVEASAGRVADEDLGAIREDGYGMDAERHVDAHAEGGIVVAQRLLKPEPVLTYYTLARSCAARTMTPLPISDTCQQEKAKG
jgi:hypothetical protein